MCGRIFSLDCHCCIRDEVVARLNAVQKLAGGTRCRIGPAQGRASCRACGQRRDVGGTGPGTNIRWRPPRNIAIWASPWIETNSRHAARHSAPGRPVAPRPLVCGVNSSGRTGRAIASRALRAASGLTRPSGPPSTTSESDREIAPAEIFLPSRARCRTTWPMVKAIMSGLSVRSNSSTSYNVNRDTCGDKSTVAWLPMGSCGSSDHNALIPA